MLDVESPEGDFIHQRMEGVDIDPILLKRKRNTVESSCNDDINNTCKVPRTQSNQDKMAIQASLAFSSSLFELLKNKLKKPNTINIKDIEACQRGISELINSIYSSNTDKIVLDGKDKEGPFQLEKISSLISNKIEDTITKMLSQNTTIYANLPLETPSTSFATTVSKLKNTTIPELTHSNTLPKPKITQFHVGIKPPNQRPTVILLTSKT